MRRFNDLKYLPGFSSGVTASGAAQAKWICRSLLRRAGREAAFSNAFRDPSVAKMLRRTGSLPCQIVDPNLRDLDNMNWW